MGLRGPKPKNKVKMTWSADLAYAIGLIATDGNLSPDGRHLTFVSKDIEQIKNFLECLDIKVKIGKTVSGYNSGTCHKVQFGDVIFYNFLEQIGLHKNKSKTMGEIIIPEDYFFDFLRGCFDGDGTFYSYWDKRWKSSHMFYLEFVSASHEHIFWLRNKLKKTINVEGHITNDGRGLTKQLKYAKKETVEIVKKMYYNPRVRCLSRKKQKIEKALKIEKDRIMTNNAPVLKLVDICP